MVVSRLFEILGLKREWFFEDIDSKFRRATRSQTTSRICDFHCGDAGEF